jgi:hypothetical protein
MFHTIVVQKKTHILYVCSITFFQKSCLRDNVEKCYTAREATDNVTWLMRFASWITNDTNIHSEYVIIACPLQQWLHERAPMLRYTYTACLVF